MKKLNKFNMSSSNTKQLVANVDCKFHRAVKNYACSCDLSIKEYLIYLIEKDFNERGISLDE